MRLQRQNNFIFKIHSGLMMKLRLERAEASRSNYLKETNFIQPFEVMTGVYPADSA